MRDDICALAQHAEYGNCSKRKVARMYRKAVYRRYMLNAAAYVYEKTGATFPMKELLASSTKPRQATVWAFLMAIKPLGELHENTYQRLC